jgi:hypothetical protein
VRHITCKSNNEILDLLKTAVLKLNGASIFSYYVKLRIIMLLSSLIKDENINFVKAIKDRPGVKNRLY